ESAAGDLAEDLRGQCGEIGESVTETNWWNLTTLKWNYLEAVKPFNRNHERHEKHEKSTY
ncbi:MAG: hypothetical protein IKN52_11070, partial [Victivallales bacterium]|nr:hypothetical protein [Victivallales bacterium]